MKESDTWMKKSIAYFKIWRVTNIGLDLPNFRFDQNGSITSLLVTDVGNLSVTDVGNLLVTILDVTNIEIQSLVSINRHQLHIDHFTIIWLHLTYLTTFNLDVSYPQKLRINSTFIMSWKQVDSTCSKIFENDSPIHMIQSERNRTYFVGNEIPVK